MPLPSRLLLAALCAWTAHAAQAQSAGDDDDDVLETDRPDFADTSQVVGKGRVQLELGVQWERHRDDAVHERTLFSPALLRIGLSDTVELRLDTEGREVSHEVEPGSGERSTTAGYADPSVGFKWRLADQQGARPSMALLGELTLPVGSRALRGRGARPSVYLPAGWEFGRGWSVEIMPGIGIGVDSDEERGGARFGYGVMAVALGKSLGERLHGFVELATPQIARAAHGGTQAVVDAGFTYLLNKDCQLDAWVVQGLNRRTPDLGLGIGLSIRR